MYLPAEVCIVVSGQPSKAKLDSAQTQQMIRHTVRKPWDNATSIVEQGIRTVGLDENSNMLMVRPVSSVILDMLIYRAIFRPRNHARTHQSLRSRSQ